MTHECHSAAVESGENPEPPRGAPPTGGSCPTCWRSEAKVLPLGACLGVTLQRLKRILQARQQLTWTTASRVPGTGLGAGIPSSQPPSGRSYHGPCVTGTGLGSRGKPRSCLRSQRYDVTGTSNGEAQRSV